MSAYEIRPATLYDAVAVAEIYAHYVRTSAATFELDPPPAEEIVSRMEGIRQLGLPYLVAEDAGQVIAYAYAGQFRPRAGYRFTIEDSIYIAPSHVGRGIGRRLLATLLDRGREAGARQMIGGISGENPASLALHVSFGFQRVGVLRSVGFKFDQWIDVMWMQRPI
jgi:L-amino acid N-acyltransferase YncA